MLEFWPTCLNHFEQRLSAQQFNTWIKPLRLEGQPESGTFRLVAPNRFVMQWVKEKFLQQIEDQCATYYNRAVSLDLCVDDNPTQSHWRNDRNGTSDSVASTNRPERFSKSRLNASFHFDSFVTGKANQLARAAAIQVSENPGRSYNPLFIYGGVGLGKTHLIHAIGNYVQDQSPSANVRYVHSEDYFADVVRAYHQKSFDSFKRYYRSLDVLLIDDIQFFNNKNRTQEEFFYAFNALTESNRQIIITCDTYPKEIIGLEDRLKSRFDWGLTVAIEPP